MASEFRRIARRSQTLRGDVGENLDDESKLRSLIEKNPIKAWCGGKGTGGTAYFRFTDSRFSSEISVPDACRQQFQNLVRELVDWRLAEYLDRGDTAETSDRLVCRVVHAGGRPILKLPDRRKTSGVPFGWVEITANGESYVANFVKQFVNVVRIHRESAENVLAEIVRGWFGPDAGRPGTRYKVAFEPSGERLLMTPTTTKSTESSTAETWRHYMPEQGEQFGDAGASPFVEPTVPESARYTTHVPVYDLSVAAGDWGPQNVPTAIGWIEVREQKLSEGMFAAQVFGRSMEPRIQDGQWCLFKPDQGGTRQNRLVLVQLNTHIDPEDGGRYTVKRYRSTETSNEQGWRHDTIELQPLNPDYPTIHVSPEDADEFRIIGELVSTIRDEREV